MVSVPEASSWLDSRRNSERENLEMMAEIVFFLDTVIDGLANVCGTGTFMFTEVTEATVVLMSETAIRFFSALRGYKFVWILH